MRKFRKKFIQKFRKSFTTLSGEMFLWIPTGEGGGVDEGVPGGDGETENGAEEIRSKKDVL